MRVHRAFVLAWGLGVAGGWAPVFGDGAWFRDEAVERGVSYWVGDGPQFGFGVCLADLTSDGLPELITVGAPDGRVGVYLNVGGSFEDASEGSGIAASEAYSGLSAADYDADEDLDLFLTRWGAPDVLLRNDGGLTFTDVSVAAGVADAGAGAGSGWGDVNGDGWLDVYVSNRTGSAVGAASAVLPQPNRLYLSDGSGGFTSAALLYGVDDGDARSFQGAFFDMDRDGDADLYLANDKGPTNCDRFRNKLWRNDGGVFVEMAHEAGADGCMDAMCVAIGDFDGNTVEDLYVTNTQMGNALYMGQHGGPYIESSGPTETRVFREGWGAFFFDYDNDAAMDLFVADALGSNLLFTYRDGDACEESAADVGLDDPGQSIGTAFADIDLDGDLDIVVSNINAPLRLYVNQGEPAGGWIQFDIRADGGNTHAIGAIVDVRVGSTWQTRQVVAGSNYKSQNDLPVHFGLADADGVDAVRVMWPGGRTRTLGSLEGGHRYRIDRWCRCDVNRDDGIDVRDVLLFVDAYLDPAGSTIDVDLDGGGVSFTDLLLFLQCWLPAVGGEACVE